MKIISAPGSLKTAAENENRDANFANAMAKIDFLCLLDGVPIETQETEQEETAHE